MPTDFSFWAWVNITLAVGAVIIPWIIFRKQKERRDLVGELSIANIIKGSGIMDISIFYKETKVNQVDLIELKIMNVGTVSVTPSDIIGLPLKMILPKDVKILSVNKIESQPENIDFSSSFTENEASFEITLLNEAEWIKINLLADGKVSFESIELQGRITNGSFHKRSPAELQNFSIKALWEAKEIRDFCQKTMANTLMLGGVLLTIRLFTWLTGLESYWKPFWDITKIVIPIIILLFIGAYILPLILLLCIYGASIGWKRIRKFRNGGDVKY